MPVFSEGSHFLVWGQGEKGRSGEPVGLPRWELVLTGSGSVYITKDLTCVVVLGAHSLDTQTFSFWVTCWGPVALLK